MNSILLQLLPLITIFSILIIIIAAIKIKVSSNKNDNSSQSNQEYRRLCKSKSNRAIAGVCGGIAEYFGWNATFVRLFFCSQELAYLHILFYLSFYQIQIAPCYKNYY